MIPPENAPRRIGRYALHARLAAGGMASVHLGRLLGPVGFSRTVAIKRLHPQLTQERSFVSMLLDEARIAARIRHPNVVPVVDVVALEGELFLVMEYVHGETLARLLINAKDQAPPPEVISRIVVDLLNGLHAAHVATDERGAPLDIVHRDVSPQNVLVGVDGVARVTDFGVAKAVNRLQSTNSGQVKGKLAYMAPEYLQGQGLDRRSDIYSTSVLLWEGLTRRRLFARKNATDSMKLIVSGEVPPPSRFAPWLSPVLDEVVMQGLARDPNKRFSTAQAMATALQECATLALPRAVGDWVQRHAATELEDRARLVQEVENLQSDDPDGLALGADLVDAVMSTKSMPAREPERPKSPGLASTMLLTDYTAPVDPNQAPAAAPAPVPPAPAAQQPPAEAPNGQFASAGYPVQHAHGPLAHSEQYTPLSQAGPPPQKSRKVLVLALMVLGVGVLASVAAVFFFFVLPRLR
ncbi:MAG TPA: serine/threonine-protein kinase [Polyangiaceae bacterium]|nr:serine/threonine-protein kinase [Polyangiaceae bacterium]